uniref:Uncharacterized protein n=1 Tax=Arundo donax TaxID=35708 RepID=A0A0A9HP93_ARUDO
MNRITKSKGHSINSTRLRSEQHERDNKGRNRSHHQTVEITFATYLRFPYP